MFRFLFRALSSTLARIPSLAYAALFLACIPLFATIYAAHGREFYHTTVMHEQAYHQIRSQVVAGVHKALASAASEAYGGNLVNDNGWIVDPDGIVITEVKARDGDLLVEMVVQAANAQSRSGGSYAISVLLSDLYGLEKEKNGEKLRYYLVLPDDLNDLPVRLDRLFPGDENYPSDKAAFLPVDRKLSRAMATFLDGARGFPSDEGGVYKRMLYFSAVTITTLGYGDIVPISDKTRTLVGLESILGLILIGLFLNSMSHEHAMARERILAKRSTQGSAGQPAPSSMFTRMRSKAESKRMSKAEKKKAATQALDLGAWTEQEEKPKK